MGVRLEAGKQILKPTVLAELVSSIPSFDKLVRFSESKLQT